MLEFKNDLSERSQRLLQDQYEQAIAEDKALIPTATLVEHGLLAQRFTGA
jgi:hypothetical protein